MSKQIAFILSPPLSLFLTEIYPLKVSDQNPEGIKPRLRSCCCLPTHSIGAGVFRRCHIVFCSAFFLVALVFCITVPPRVAGGQSEQMRVHQVWLDVLPLSPILANK